MKITKDAVVQIHYTLTGEDGQTFDTSRNGEPLEYLHGNGNLINGLEEQLEGKEPGDRFTAVVAPKDAYGEYDERLVVKVPRNQFDSDMPIEVGMRFQADTVGGPMIVTVTNVTDDTITVDGNHALAGKTLHFAVDVVDVREATPEELMPKSHGCGGCGGGCGGSCGDDDSCGCGGGCGGDCGSDNGGCGCGGGCC